VASGDLRMQWKDAVAEHTDGSPVMALRDEGPDKRRDFYARAKELRPRYVMVGYEHIVSEWRTLKGLKVDCVVADEVTAIKSFEAERSDALKAFPSQFRFGLTGDPVENRADELFSIMQWVDPAVLGSPEMFDITYVVRSKSGFVVGYRNLPTLHRIMTRTGAWFVKTEDDPEVAKYLPTKLPVRIHRVTMDKASAGLYDRIADDLLEHLYALAGAKGGKFNLLAYYAGDKAASAAQGKVASRLLALRMLCAHPLALKASGDAWLNAGPQPNVRKKITVMEDGKKVEKVVMAPRTKPGSEYAARLVDDGYLDGLTTSAKFDRLVEEMDVVLDEDDANKVVAFSFFKFVLDQLGPMYGPEAVVYKGGTSTKKKYELRTRFQTDPNVRAFLSSDAGGYGLDLPQANHLFNYDTPFSGGRQRQRNTRIRRAASPWSHVQVHDLLYRGAVDVYYHDMTGRKLALGDALKSGRTVERGGRITMSVGSLTEFLESHRPSDRG
jgi:SNF2 family DNA or RNA helicase